MDASKQLWMASLASALLGGVVGSAMTAGFTGRSAESAPIPAATASGPHPPPDPAGDPISRIDREIQAMKLWLGQLDLEASSTRKAIGEDRGRLKDLEGADAYFRDQLTRRLGAVADMSGF